MMGLLIIASLFSVPPGQSAAVDECASVMATVDSVLPGSGSGPADHDQGCTVSASYFISMVDNGGGCDYSYDISLNVVGGGFAYDYDVGAAFYDDFGDLVDEERRSGANQQFLTPTTIGYVSPPGFSIGYGTSLAVDAWGVNVNLGRPPARDEVQVAGSLVCEPNIDAVLRG